MGFRSFAADFREVHQNLAALLAPETEEERQARLALTRGARRFTRRTRSVVDDKLTFSATLMRAGEVDAATRLLEEVEVQVREEEAALIEVVNEVRAARSMDRSRMTRIRLARMMAAALAAASLLASSAIGVALAGALSATDDEVVLAPYDGTGRRARLASRSGSAATTLRDVVRKLRIGDVRITLTASEYRRLTQLTQGAPLAGAELAEIIELLPASLAAKVSEAVAAAESAAEPVLQDAGRVVAEVEKEAGKREDEAKASAEEPREEPAAEPSDEPAGSGSGGEGDAREGDGDGGREGDSPLPPRAGELLHPDGDDGF